MFSGKVHDHTLVLCHVTGTKVADHGRRTAANRRVLVMGDGMSVLIGCIYGYKERLTTVRDQLRAWNW